MASTGRIPLWLIATVGGTAALTVVGLFIFGSYSGVDSKPKVDVSMSSAEGAARKYTASFFLTGEDSYALAA